MPDEPIYGESPLEAAAKLRDWDDVVAEANRGIHPFLTAVVNLVRQGVPREDALATVLLVLNASNERLLAEKLRWLMRHAQPLSFLAVDKL